MFKDESFYNSDGDLLIVPEQGVLRVRTECGLLEVAPGECMVLPQGMKMTVELKDGHASSRGWVAEIFEGHFSLPNRGPFGSNGMRLLGLSLLINRRCCVVVCFDVCKGLSADRFADDNGFCAFNTRSIGPT